MNEKTVSDGAYDLGRICGIVAAFAALAAGAAHLLDQSKSK